MTETKNHAKEIAEMLGLEIGEKFRIKGHPDMGTFWFIEDGSMGLRDIWDYEEGSECYDVFENCNDLLEQLLTGFYEVEKLPWKPKCHDSYYYVIGGGLGTHIDSSIWLGTVEDLANWKAGNCFKTAEAADEFRSFTYEKLKKEFEEA